jgi:NAD(P)-dependent dehydrogenase (short-subunit alcohol dehydrogenase family)
MSYALDGKVAVITGAASGIGLATVELFIARGARVIAADIQDDKGAALAARFKGALEYVSCDVLDEAQIKAALARAVSAFGGLDILFNNAGAAGIGALEETSSAAWDKAMALLVRSVFVGTREAIPLMRARGGGAIVNTASIAGLQAGWGPVAYSAAKAAVIQFTRAAAPEIAKDKIRINAICPGFIATSIFGGALGLPTAHADQMAAMLAESDGKMQPIRRTGQGHDIAEAAAFLASDASSFMTGTHLVVDGGITVGPAHAWRDDVANPFLEALGISPEQAEQMRLAQAAKT